MPPSYTQVTTAVTRDEAFTDLVSLLDSVKFKASSWQEGSIPYTLTLIGAHLYSKASEFWGFIAKQNYIDEAIGTALTKLSKSHYDNTRKEAVATQIRGKFTTASGEGPHSVDVGDIVISDSLGHTFRNVAGLGVVYPVNLTSASPVTLLMEAEKAGADHNVADDTVTQMVTTLAGVTVTNAADPTSGTSIVTTGTDEESDSTLEERDATKWATLAVESVRDAVRNVALGASSAIAKAEADGSNPRGAGTTDIYIAGAAVVAGSGDVTAAQTAIDKRFFDNAGTPPRVQVVASAATTVNVEATIYYDSSFTETQVMQAVEAALLQFFKDTPLGGWDYSPGPANVVRVNDLENVIREATYGTSKVVKTVTVTTPASDLSIAAFNVVVPGAYPSDYQPI